MKGYQLKLKIDVGSPLEIKVLAVLRRTLPEKEWERCIRRLKRDCRILRLPAAVMHLTGQAQGWAHQLQVKTIGDLLKWRVGKLQERGVPARVIRRFSAELTYWGYDQRP